MFERAMHDVGLAPALSQPFDQDQGRLLDPRDGENGEQYPDQGSTCQPGGVIIEDVKPYWYIVQPEDVDSFWRIPEKFNLPTKRGSAWTWHELRNANTDWPGGFVRLNDACVLQGLTAGAKLHVPASWPEPRPGVTTKKKTSGERGARFPWGSVALAAGGLIAVGGLVWLAGKRRR